MIKSIGYAYASSNTAKRLGAYRTGCYFISTHRDETDHIDRALIGPFATIEEAEERAKGVEGRWSRFTRRAGDNLNSSFASAL